MMMPLIKPKVSTRLRRPAKGMAALTVVMIIFFVMALVAAYTNRNLVFEQRISTNSYKSARALNTAEAAIDWTLSMLNGGAIDDNCTAPLPVSLAAKPKAYPDFRLRYLTQPADITATEGRYDFQGGAPGSEFAMYPACIIDAEAKVHCICPSLDQSTSPPTRNKTPTMVTPADGIGSAFSVSLENAGNLPGVLNIIAVGCANIGDGDTACYNQDKNAHKVSVVDAKTGVSMTLALVRALPLAAQAPGYPQLATLTTGGDVTISKGTLKVANDDRGLTVHAGGAIKWITNPSVTSAPVYTGAAGSRNALVSASDGALSDLAQPKPPGNPWFLSLFGMLPAQYKMQPALIVVPCVGGKCTSTDLAPILALYPRHPIWVQGDLTIDKADALGDMTTPVLPSPVMLVVDGTLTVAAATPITGFLHANKIVWSDAGATVRGALVTPGSFTASSDATLIYDRAVLNTIRLYYGSFVRVPGSWNTSSF